MSQYEITKFQQQKNTSSLESVECGIKSDENGLRVVKYKVPTVAPSRLTIVETLKSEFIFELLSLKVPKLNNWNAIRKSKL